MFYDPSKALLLIQASNSASKLGEHLLTESDFVSPLFLGPYAIVYQEYYVITLLFHSQLFPKLIQSKKV